MCLCAWTNFAAGVTEAAAAAAAAAAAGGEAASDVSAEAAPLTSQSGGESTLTIRWSSWWNMNRKFSTTPVDPDPKLASADGTSDMDASDLSSLENGLASAVNVLNSTSLTNSSSCHDWTGDFQLHHSIRARFYLCNCELV